MSTQLGLHTFDIKWVEVEPGIYLPDLADLLIQRLTDTKPLKVDHDLAAIGRNAVRQIDEVRGKRYLRLSSSGSCVKQLSYVAHEIEPVVLDDWDPGAIDAGSRLTFTIGDVTESVLNAALCEVIAESGIMEVEATGDEQVEVSLDVLDQTITGHPDGFMRVPVMADGIGVHANIRAVWEVKSMADFGYNLFRKEGMTEDSSYYWQVQSYMGAESEHSIKVGADPVGWAYIVGYGKTTTSRDTEILPDGTWRRRPPIHGQWIRFEPAALDKVYAKFAMRSHPDEIPRPFGPKTGKRTKGQLGFPCGWCPYAFNCFPNATVEATEGGFYVRNNKVVIHANEES